VQSTEYIDFRQYWFILRRRWLPATVVFGSVVAITALATLLQKPVYEAKGKLLIKTPNNVNSTLPEGRAGQDLGKLSSVGSTSDPLETEIELISSLSLAQKTIKNLNLNLKPEQFLQRLSVKNIKGTDILELSYKSTVPQEDALAVNQIMSLYLEGNILSNRTEAAAAGDFIEKQLPNTESTVHKAEVALRKFQQENNIVALDEESKSAVTVIANLENQITNSRAELTNASAQSAVLRNKLAMNSQDAVAATSIAQSPGVQNVLQQVQQLESQLAVARTRYQETHPTINQLKSQIALLEALLEKRVGNVIGTQKQEHDGNFQTGALKQQLTAELVGLEARRLGLTEQISALWNILAAYKQRVNALPRLQQRQRELERSLQASQSIYTTLLQRLQEIQVEENRNLGNVRIVEKAQVPQLPVGPDKVKNLVLGSVAGILLAIGTALLLEMLDTSIKTVKEARQVFGYTFLGLIPFFGKSKNSIFPDRNPEEDSASKIVVRELPRSSISEAFQMLQANLKFVNSDKNLKVIVVTSSVPQEGKSTVSANLAVVMAHSGRRVLLVDADMRRPVQHQILDLINDAGLSNVLVGQAELRTVIKEVSNNLHVLSAGVIPPNPMALLDSQRMASLIQNFSDSYEFVIIDTPSVNVAADALILGKMTDGVLLVVRPGVVDSASAASAKEFLEQSGQNVLGQVVNGLPSENKSYNYYAKENNAEENSKTRETATSVTRRNSGRS